MKKSLLLALCATLALSGCSYQNRGINSLNATTPTVETRPLEASVQVGRKMTGRAQCSSYFWIFNSWPDKQAYGATLQNSSGNTDGFFGNCTRGAIYNALSQTNADLIVAPHYEVKDTRFLCIPIIPFQDACLYSKRTVEVTGYEGHYTNIKEMAPDVVKERQKNPEFHTKTSLTAISIFN